MSASAFKTAILLVILATSTACASGGSLLADAASPDGRYRARLLDCPDPADFQGRELLGIVFESQGPAPACQETHLPNVRAWFAAAAPRDGGAGSVEWVDGQARFALSGNIIKSQSPPPAPGGLITIVGAGRSNDGN